MKVKKIYTCKRLVVFGRAPQERQKSANGPQPATEAAVEASEIRSGARPLSSSACMGHVVHALHEGTKPNKEKPVGRGRSARTATGLYCSHEPRRRSRPAGRDAAFRRRAPTERPPTLPPRGRPTRGLELGGLLYLLLILGGGGAYLCAHAAGPASPDAA